MKKQRDLRDLWRQFDDAIGQGAMIPDEPVSPENGENGIADSEELQAVLDYLAVPPGERAAPAQPAANALRKLLVGFEAALSAEGRDELARRLEVRTVPAGAALCGPGGEDELVGVVVCGEFAVALPGRPPVAPATLNSGKLLGPAAAGSRQRVLTAAGEAEARVATVGAGEYAVLVEEERVREARARVHLLAHVHAFRHIDNRRLLRLALAATGRRLAHGEALIAEGDPADCVFVIRSGFCNIVRGLQRAGEGAALPAISPGGAGAVVVARVGPRALVGELAVLARSRRTASVLAAGPVAALELPAEALLRAADERTVAGLWEGAMSYAVSRLDGPELARLPHLRRLTARLAEPPEPAPPPDRPARRRPPRPPRPPREPQEAGGAAAAHDALLAATSPRSEVPPLPMIPAPPPGGARREGALPSVRSGRLLGREASEQMLQRAASVLSIPHLPADEVERAAAHVSSLAALSQRYERRAAEAVRRASDVASPPAGRYAAIGPRVDCHLDSRTLRLKLRTGEFEGRRRAATARGDSNAASPRLRSTSHTPSPGPPSPPGEGEAAGPQGGRPGANKGEELFGEVLKKIEAYASKYPQYVSLMLKLDHAARRQLEHGPNDAMINKINLDLEVAVLRRAIISTKNHAPAHSIFLGKYGESGDHFTARF